MDKRTIHKALPLVEDLASTSQLLWNNLSIHCEYVSLLLVNKEADWPIARKDKVRQDNLTEDAGINGD